MIIPNSVTSIGSSAFDGCKALNGKLILSKNLTEINSRSFIYTSLKGDLIVPDSVTTIGSYAFYGNQNINGTLRIGKSVNSIKDNAFGSTKIKIVDFSRAKELKEVKDNAFSSVSNVLSYVPNKDVMSLLSKVLPDANNTYAVTNGGTFKDSTKFEEGKLATPTREDALFIGWSEHGCLSGNLVTNTTKGKTYYAKWKELNSITLEYDKESKIDFDKGIVVESKDSSVVTVDGNKLKAVGLRRNYYRI